MMTASAKIIRPYGTWDSPIRAESLSRELRLEDPAWDRDGSLVWLEGRVDRSVPVVLASGDQAPRDLNDLFSARGGVGYGGGAFTVGCGWVFFIEAKTGRIYRQPTNGGPATPITPGFGACAAPVLSPDGSRLLFIRSYEGLDSLEIVETAGRQWPQILSAGDDFVMQPAWHPDGHRLAWIAWNHPNMPWDGTELRLGRLEFSPGGAASLLEVQTVAGGAEISIFQPQFSPDGRFLAYASDESGWWQLVLYDLQSGERRNLTDTPAEHAEPAWVQGRRTFGFAPDGRRIFFLRNRDAVVQLWQVDIASGSEAQVELGEEYTYLEQISIGASGIALLASGGRTPKRLIVCQLPALPGSEVSPAQVRIVRRSASEEFAPVYYSAPETLDWPGEDRETVHALYYPPHHPAYEGVGLPPLIVAVHGGPTGQVHRSFSGETQYFTSRGWGVLWVNFRGSAGYGRRYRNRLRKNWGVIDVEDTVAGARFLVESGRVDPKRVVILGGSSGGLVVLKALEDYPGVFKAGVCRYGVADQFALAAETHKFEAHYADRLIGPLPEAADLYRKRSPAFFVDRIRDPIALFQGEEDASVPRSQMDAVAAELRRRGTPHIYHVYPGEGHGFRKPETIVHYYRAVDDFLLKNVLWS